LGPSHFFEGGSDGNGFLSVNEYSTKLCFSCGRGDDFIDFADNEDKTIEEGSVVFKVRDQRRSVAEEMNSAGSAACPWCLKEGHY